MSIEDIEQLTGTTFDHVEVPQGLSPILAERAKRWVMGRYMEGLNVEETCKRYKLSTGTLYNDYHLKSPIFNRYIERLTANLVQNDIEDFKIIKNKVTAEALKPTASIAEKRLYFDTVWWVGDYYNKKMLEKHGITNTDEDVISIEAKRQSLLKRLRE